MSEQTKGQIDFSVFLLYQLAAAWGVSVPEAYDRLSRSGILNEYVLPCYDMLHTLGSQYLVSDLTDMARERGVLA